MKCPDCGGKSKVKNVYATKKRKDIRRQRICEECGLKFHTYEEMATKDYLKGFK